MTDCNRPNAPSPRNRSARNRAGMRAVAGAAAALMLALLAPAAAPAAATMTMASSSCSAGPSPGGGTQVAELAASGQSQRVRTLEGVLSGVPDYQWWYGCAPTAAGMLMGYYDRNGYDGRDYSNLIPGAVAGLSTFPSTAGSWTYPAQNYIASSGHVADFYRGGLGAVGDDRPSARAPNSLADFMGTSQDNLPYSGGTHSNANGSTTSLFYYNYYLNDPTTLYAVDGTQDYVRNRGDQGLDGGYGMWEYFVNQGYDGDHARVSTKYIDDYQFTKNGQNYIVTDGFTYNEFIGEIYAGRPVVIYTDNHAMLGYGWKANFLEEQQCATRPDGSQDCVWHVVDRQLLIDVHDTWTAGAHLMEWGGTYGGANQVGVTTFIPYVVPEPAGAGLLLAAVGMLIAARRRAAGRA